LLVGPAFIYVELYTYNAPMGVVELMYGHAPAALDNRNLAKLNGVRDFGSVLRYTYL
jgi:hypothetical protein